MSENVANGADDQTRGNKRDIKILMFHNDRSRDLSEA